MVPKATTIALLVNPTSPNLAEAQARDLQTAARTLGLQIHVYCVPAVTAISIPFSQPWWLAEWIYRGYRVARSQRGELFAPTKKK
jgi:hypothetical protein